MHCRNCDFFLSIQNFDRAEWVDEIEEFIFICPKCKHEIKLVSFLFEHGHISDQYLETIARDTEELYKEKYLDYMPKMQHNFLISHLSNCSYCSEKLESFRLNRISEQFESHVKVYNFFMSQAKHVSEIQNSFKIVTNGVGIKMFVFDGVSYNLSKNLFYDQIKENKHNLCYFLERDSYIAGMVSFIKIQKKIFLDRIWLKSQERMEKEKKFFNSLNCIDIKILYDLVRKKYSFL